MLVASSDHSTLSLYSLRIFEDRGNKGHQVEQIEGKGLCWILKSWLCIQWAFQQAHMRAKCWNWRANRRWNRQLILASTRAPLLVLLLTSLNPLFFIYLMCCLLYGSIRCTNTQWVRTETLIPPYVYLWPSQHDYLSPCTRSHWL